jgi:AAA15 family ATPase/GTPase
LEEVITDLKEQNIYKGLELRKDKLLKDYREFVAAKLNIDWIDTDKIGIVAFTLKKFHGIDEVKLDGIPINTQWIFLTGQNGFGKTSILRALSLGLIRTGLEYLNLDENTRSEVMFFQDIGFNRFIYGANNYTRTYFANVAAYGAKRTDLSDKNIPATSESLFEKTNSLYDFETMYKEWKIFPKENQKKISNFEELMKMVIPNLSKIEIDRETSKVIYFEKTETGEELTPVPFNQLAMGMRSILAMIADLVYRLTHSKFEFTISNGTTNIEGIVLIDEFDNHLHPKWQRMLVEKLTRLLPKVQFIVSTHSEIPLLGAPKNSVVLKVNRTKEEGITCEKLDIDLSELPPENILSSPIFDFHDVIPQSYRQSKRLRTEKGYDEIEFYKILEEKIQTIANEAGVDYKTVQKNDSYFG